MSGGSLNYVYLRIDDAADSIAARSTKPLHRAFATHLRLVSAALHDLEWVWSCDKSEGDEDAAIRKVTSRAEELSCARESTEKAIEDAKNIIFSIDGYSK